VPFNVFVSKVSLPFKAAGALAASSIESKVPNTELNHVRNHGLPCSKQRGKVYFLYSEVLEYIKANRPKKYLEIA
jgi:hypothetical protein